MLITEKITGDTLELIRRVAIADVVRVNGENYAITSRGVELNDQKEAFSLASKLEDHDVIFETDYHTFTWFELVQDTERLNDQEWRIGDDDVISFYTLSTI